MGGKNNYGKRFRDDDEIVNLSELSRFMTADEYATILSIVISTKTKKKQQADEQWAKRQYGGGRGGFSRDVFSQGGIISQGGGTQGSLSQSGGTQGVLSQGGGTQSGGAQGNLSQGSGTQGDGTQGDSTQSVLSEASGTHPDVKME